MEKIGENVKIKKIAITGIVASGKSTVCDILAKNEGAYVIKSDEVVHRLYSQNKEIRKQLADSFGEDVILQGEIDRKKLAQIVFHDENALKKLEKIVHPHVIEVIKKTYDQVKDLSYTAFVVEFPLLFEIGFDKWFDKNIVVMSNESECRKRFNDSEKACSFDERMAFQLSQSEKCTKADLIINNRGSFQELQNEVHRQMQLV